MSLLKSNEGGNSSLEPKVFQHSLEKNSTTLSVKTLKTLASLALGVGINGVFSQTSFADQLPKSEVRILLAQKYNYNYSSASYNYEEEPILTGKIQNRIEQLKKYIKDFDEFHQRKFQYSFEEVKYARIRAKLVKRVGLLERQLSIIRK